MAVERVERRLSAILAADIAGYSALMGADEVRTVRDLKDHQAVVLPMIGEHGGRVIDTAGDGILAEFASVVNALECAVTIQEVMGNRDAPIEPARRMRFRIGVNIGDVICDAARIYGDGVNVAARLEGLAEPGEVYISGAVFDQVKGKLDLAFDDLGPQQVKNIAQPVRVFRVKLDGKNQSGSDQPVFERPSVAVLPFQNMSGDPEQDFFADGLVEDIITTLSKLSGLVVIARNSSFAYKGRAVDVRTIAKELGVRFVLEGSVRKGGNRIRITAQLIDAGSGAHLWAERYDRSIDDIFAVQDEITLVLATEMQVKLTEGEQARLRYTTTGNVEAWTKWAEGLSHFRKVAPTKDSIHRVRACWERALALDSTSASLNAMVGFTYYVYARFGWDDRDTALKRGRDYVDGALALDPDNADAHMTLGLLLMVMRRFEEAVIHARKSVALAPGSADAAAFAAVVLGSSDHPQEAVVQIEKAIALSPNCPGNYLGILGNAYRLAGRHAEAISAYKAYHERNPGFGLIDLVIIYQQTSRPELAKEAASKLLSIRKDFTIETWLITQQYRMNTAQVDADIAALAGAGLPMR
jgi:adenylate cyclase